MPSIGELRARASAPRPPIDDSFLYRHLDDCDGSQQDIPSPSPSSKPSQPTNPPNPSIPHMPPQPPECVPQSPVSAPAIADTITSLIPEPIQPRETAKNGGMAEGIAPYSRENEVDVAG